MTFNREKVLAEGGVYHDEKNPLVECVPFTPAKVSWEPVNESIRVPSFIKEDVTIPKRMVIEGVFQRFMPPGADPEKYRNANKRIYTMERVGKKILDPNGDVQRRIAERAMIGHVEHPHDGVTDLMKGAILITKVWAESDGTIMGRALVYNNPPGLMVQEYINTGTKIGISSRGTGTVDAQGYVCEDFQLETWDIVYNPSTFGAYPTLAQESRIIVPVEKPMVEKSFLPRTMILQETAPMSLAQRISESQVLVNRLLAIDPKKLTIDERRRLAGEMLDLRVDIAKKFVGEERVAEVDRLIKSLDEARKAVEENSDGVSGYGDSALGAPQTPVAIGLPGTWDSLDKALNNFGASRPQVEGELKSLWSLIMDHLDKVRDLRQALAGVLKPKTEEEQKVVEQDDQDGFVKLDEAQLEELYGLLRESRDELMEMSEREEAASAIIAQLTEEVVRLQGEVEEATLREQKAAAIIAELTSTAGKAPVAESNGDAKHEKKPSVQGSEERKTGDALPATKVKVLAEKIAADLKSSKSGDVPLPTGRVASRPDAAVVRSKDSLHEDAHVVTAPKSGADLLVKSGVIQRISESQGFFR